FVGLLVLSGLSLTIGATHPLPDLVPGLDRCGEQMCYFGIAPGQTDWATALAILRLHATNLDTRAGRVYVNDENQETYIYPAESRDHVAAINITLLRSYPTLGAVIAHYGPPCGVTFNGNVIAIDYPDALFSLADSMLSPTVQVYILDMSDGMCQD